MSAEAVKIEGIVSSLSEYEKEVEALKAQAEVFIREIVALAREEAEVATASAVEETTKKATAILEVARKEANEEARRILQRSEAEVARRKARMLGAIDRAVENVVAAVLRV